LMMQYLVVLVLCSLLVGTYSKIADPPSENILLFIEGFALGLEIEIGDPALCAKDVNVTEEDFIDGFNKIKNGINKYSISEIEAGLRDWANGIYEVNLALRDCGAGKIADDIESIMQELQSGTTGLLEFIARELLAIIDNDISDLFEKAFDAIEAGDWKTAGLASGEITGILLNQ